MSKIVIVTVTRANAAGDVHPDDVSVAGVYGVVLGDGPGEYPDEPQDASVDGDPLEEAALDVFHDHVGIKVMEDFEVDVHVTHGDDDIPDDTHWL